MSVLRGARGSNAARDACGSATLAGTRRAEPLSRVRAAGGRRPHAAHARSLAELGEDELAESRRRGGAARRRADGYLHALVNEGRAGGSSLPHTHSQLVWLPEPPPETRHRGRPRSLDRRHRARRPRRRAARTRVGFPYELVIAPAEPRGEASSTAASARAPAARRHGAAAAPRRAVPLNAWLHDSADWHLELLPRLDDPRRRRARRGLVDQPVPPEEAADGAAEASL